MQQNTRTLNSVDEGDAVGIEYESIHSDAMAESQTEILTIVDTEWEPVAENNEGERYTLRTDGDVVTEIAKHDKHDIPQRVGYPERVVHIGWN